MASLILPPSWRLPEREVTPEAAWLDRRSFIRGLGLGAVAGAAGCARFRAKEHVLPERYAWELPPTRRNPRYAGGTEPAVELTPEVEAARYNNFYEFGADKGGVWRRAASLRVRPWTVEVGGACHAPRTFDLDELLRTMPLEERITRFRCVEAWSMVVPWIGFPLRALLEAVQPTASARFVRLVSFGDEAQLPGIAESPWYPWPYHEGLTIAEATHELALLAVGIYGHALPNQHGAPIRLVTPWKYGYKQLKSIVKIELVEQQPPTFWSTLAAEEYDFAGNVRPDIPHPRWSQATERVIPTGERVPTRMYNGYAEQVAGLYAG